MKQINGYEMKGVIAEGSDSEIRKAVHIETNIEVAVKIQSIKRLKILAFGYNFLKHPRGLFYNKDVLELLLIGKEYNIVRSINCEHIIKYFDIFAVSNGRMMKENERFEDWDEVYLIMEPCNSDLERYIKNGNLDYTDIRKIAIKIASSLGYLHKRGIYHFDLKPSNILINNTGEIKLSDFSTFKTTEKTCSIDTTPMIVSPESASLEGDEFSTSKADIWAYGITLYFMIHKKYPYNANDQYGLWKLIRETKEITIEVDNEWAKRVIPLLLSVDPGRRPDITEVLDLI